MKFIGSAFLCMVLFGLVGCEVIYPRVHIRSPIIVEPGVIDGGRIEGREGGREGGGHCPPGQAKKGNC